MKYCLVENNIVTNIIVCNNDKTASQLNALPFYPLAEIGQSYSPPQPSYESYIGTGADTIVLCYDSTPQTIFITYGSHTVVLPYGLDSYSNISLTWNNNKVIIDSNELNQVGVKYYITYT